MCRILFAKSEKPFAIASLLKPLAELSRDSCEYQGHGWGLAWIDKGKWQLYHNIKPIWEDDLTQFGETSLLLVHARSAFRDEGIVVENNMPFSDGESVFIFNGELRGVKIKSEGRIGATEKAVDIIKKRCSYIRAMNIIMSDGRQHVLSTSYSETPDYFQMQQKQLSSINLVCSQPFPGESDWQPIANHSTLKL
jgi:glutamine amidotransferase